MRNTSTQSPSIGVFDSGFGGLTVLRALLNFLPQAQFSFLGDTARLPYGSKSRRTIARYAAESARFLVEEQGAEYLVIACNTASALALDAIQEAVTVPVLGVIEPGAAAARAASRTGDVLVIATDATVQSHAYSAACQALGLRALEKACPLLVPLVEEGWVEGFLPPALKQDAPSPSGLGTGECTIVRQPDKEPTRSRASVTAEVIRIYLDDLLQRAFAQHLNPDVLVLGCTHYPLLRPLIERALPPQIRVIDSAEAAAHAAGRLIGAAPISQGEHRIDREPVLTAPVIHCFATDSVEKFERLGSRFLGRPVGTVRLVDLGG